MIEHALIMAAGRGSRMDGLTHTRPKAMLPVMGKPMIARVMDRFYDVGIRRFTVVVGEHEGSVAGWLGQKWHVDASMEFLPQGFKRGTVAALMAAREVLDGPFILSSCDNLITQEHAGALRAYFDEHPTSVAALSVINSPQEMSESAAVMLGAEGNVTSIAEKPGEDYQGALAAISVYVFSLSVLDYLDAVQVSKRGEHELTSAIMAMIDDGQPVGHVEAEWRRHMTYPQDLLRVNMLYLQDGRDANILSDLPKDVRVIPPVRVDPQVTVGIGSVIGPNVYLERGTALGQDVRVDNSLVLGRRVSAGQVISNQVVHRDC